MNDFKSEYQSAVQDMDMLGMKEVHIDALSVMDESRHRKRVMKRMQRVTMTTFSTVCIIFLCGFGTVKAAEYIGNVIKVSEWGFESGDAATMARNEAGGGRSYIIEDEVCQTPKDTAAPSGSAQPALTAEISKARMVETSPAAEGEDASKLNSGEVEASGSNGARLQAGDPDMGQSAAADSSQKKQNGEAETSGQGAADISLASEKQESGDSRAESGAIAETALALEDVIEQVPVKNYSSWEELEENEDILFPQPSISIGNQITSVDITVCGDWAMVRYDVDGKVLWVERTDYADTQGHASSKVFPGGVCNERSYTTSQGYTYTLIDSVKGAEDDMLQIHAAVTVGSYEAFIDFMGYTEEDAEKIMESIDLSVYE